MKTLLNITIAKASIALGGCFCMAFSSCAMSEQRSGEIGKWTGAAGGGALGYAVGKKNGRTKGDAIKMGLVGAGAGGVLGELVGKKSSSLKGLGGVE